jgi:hypothetical protein
MFSSRWEIKKLEKHELFHSVRVLEKGFSLDLDSTIFSRHGTQQQGAARGYNPRRPGRLSHHPLLAVLAEANFVLHSWLRSGNAGAATSSVYNTCSRYTQLRTPLSCLPSLLAAAADRTPRMPPQARRSQSSQETARFAASSRDLKRRLSGQNSL